MHGSKGPKAHAWPRKSREARPRVSSPNRGRGGVGLAGDGGSTRSRRAAVGSWRRRPYEAEGDQSEADGVGTEAEAESGLLEKEAEGSRGRAWLHAGGRTEAEGSWLAGDGGRGESGTCMTPCRRTDGGRGELAAIGSEDGGRTRPRRSSPRPTRLGPKPRQKSGLLETEAEGSRGRAWLHAGGRTEVEGSWQQSGAETKAVRNRGEAVQGRRGWDQGRGGIGLAADGGRGESGTCMALCRRMDRGQRELACWRRRPRGVGDMHGSMQEEGRPQASPLIWDDDGNSSKKTKGRKGSNPEVGVEPGGRGRQQLSQGTRCRGRQGRRSSGSGSRGRSVSM